MTVLYFADTRFPIERANGVQTMATCEALARRGHDVTLVVRPDTASVPRDPFTFYGIPPLDRLRITTIGSASDPRVRRARFLLGAATMAATANGAVVFTRDLGLASFLLQFPSIRRPRVVYESHGLAPVVAEELPRLLGGSTPAPSAQKLERLDRREQRVWSRAPAYVTLTTMLADDLATRYGARDHVYVVPDGTRLSQATPLAPPASPIVAAYAGHLYPWKGVDIFVRALAHTPAIHGLIIGGHPAESDHARVETLAQALGVAERITFTGLIPPQDVATHLGQASMLVLPNTSSTISERYTSPLKLFEYLTLERPIVASDLPSIREVLTDEVNALLVAPGDVDALARAMRRLAADPALARTLAGNARDLAPKYSWDRRAERLEPALEAAAA